MKQNGFERHLFDPPAFVEYVNKHNKHKELLPIVLNGSGNTVFITSNEINLDSALKMIRQMNHYYLLGALLNGQIVKADKLRQLSRSTPTRSAAQAAILSTIIKLLIGMYSSTTGLKIPATLLKMIEYGERDQ
ncbi:hypothetical protein ACOME3_006888 [Neoechinorhynchus agilis]